MGKNNKFECFKGYSECTTATFVDSVGNSFTLNIRLRSYCRGIVLFNWDSTTITLNGVQSNGVFTSNGFSIGCHFNSEFSLSTFRAPAYFSNAVSATIIPGTLSFSGNTPVLNSVSNLTPSTTLTIYGGSATWAQTK